MFRLGSNPFLNGNYRYILIMITGIITIVLIFFGVEKFAMTILVTSVARVSMERYATFFMFRLCEKWGSGAKA